MKTQRLIYALALFALLAVLANPASASDCSEMPCCVEVEMQCQVSPAQQMDCGDTMMGGGCTCNLQSELPISVTSEVPLQLFRFRIERTIAQEIVAPERRQSEAPKIFWLPRSHFCHEDVLLTFPSFPNPPPAAA